MLTRVPGRSAAYELAAIAERAKSLGESAAAARARVRSQQDAARALIQELQALRTTLAALPAPQTRAAAKETVAPSARTTVSFPARRSLWSAAPYALLPLMAWALHKPLPSVRTAADAVAAAAPEAPPAAPALDADAEQALLLAHEWRAPGDALPLIDRLGYGLSLPGTASAWDAERTGRNTFRVTFRPAGAKPYQFDVDLDSEKVDALPSTLSRLPRLSARR